jgi:hypothetical protein
MSQPDPRIAEFDSWLNDRKPGWDDGTEIQKAQRRFWEAFRAGHTRGAAMSELERVIREDERHKVIRELAIDGTVSIEAKWVSGLLPCHFAGKVKA